MIVLYSKPGRLGLGLGLGIFSSWLSCILKVWELPGGWNLLCVAMVLHQVVETGNFFIFFVKI